MTRPQHHGSARLTRLALILIAALLRPTGASAQVAPQANPAPADATTAGANDAAPAPEDWAIHAQSTFTPMYHPGFSAAFSGPQSLDAHDQARETWDVTLYAGFRPWTGAEFWVNPEVDQGFGLSNTFGVAGYLSGEAYKVGASDPYFLIQRAFLRQTIDLGGGTQKVDPDLNQLGGTQTANRLVFTAGKFSVVDVFDNNKYAHDPRNDFLNWSIIDMSAFDYAANTWGYTYGASAEWYQDWWTLRAGVFDLSTIPNGENLAPGLLPQRQWAAELEERHTLWDQPGKLKALYWIDQGNLGTYSAAISLGQATGTTPSTGAVRSFRTKSGGGLNLEQQLMPDLGFFARASLSQGNVEEDAFTDVNQSLSAGFSLNGNRWGRSDDTVGLAGAINLISHEGKLYLAAGGLGGIIGDGALRNAGPEQIIEAYYSIPLFSFAHLTVDYQFVDNPAYNRDRGPVSVFGLRVHAAF